MARTARRARRRGRGDRRRRAARPLALPATCATPASAAAPWPRRPPRARRPAGPGEQRRRRRLRAARRDDRRGLGRILATNLTAVFRLTRAALPHLTQAGGHVFMVSSLAGSEPIAGMARVLREQGGPRPPRRLPDARGPRSTGVKVTTIAPGSVDTELRRLPRAQRHVVDAARPTTSPAPSSTCCGRATAPT